MLKKGVFLDVTGSQQKGKAAVWCVKTDGGGNIYFAGTYEEALAQGYLIFDNQLMPIAPNQKNICILKLNSSGSAIWSKTIVGAKDNQLYSADLAIDSAGNVFLGGLFAKMVDFNPDAGVANLTSTGTGQNVFLLKLKNDGSFEWVKHFRATNAQGTTLFGPSVAVQSDAVVIAGSFVGGIDLDPGVATKAVNSAGNYDIFMVKLTQSGNHVWSRTIGGTNLGGENTFGDNCNDIIIDQNKNIWFTGSFWGDVDFNPNAGVNNLTVGGSYVLKLDANANFIWAKKFTGGTPYDIGLDQDMNVYVTGGLKGIADFDPSNNIFNLDSGNDIHTFVTSLSSAGNFRWAKRLGSLGGWVYPSNLAANSSGVYLTGSFTKTDDFNPDAGVLNLVSAGGNDIYLTKLSTTTGSLQWAKRIGAKADEVGLGITLDLSGNLISVGYFTGKVDFDPSVGALFLDSSFPAEHIQLYVLKMKTDGNL